MWKRFIVTVGALAVLSGCSDSQGATGPTGPTGPAGAPGPTGPTGSTGAVGASGAIGPTGATGAQGPQGPSGLTGPQGPAGAVGPAGAPGLVWRGDWNSSTAYTTGDAVARLGSSYVAITPSVNAAPPDPSKWGLLASQGVEGATGPAGQAGPTGPVGPQGDIGPQGPTGPQGDIGPQGLAGPQGVAGPQGPVGATGAQGLQGIQGPQGVKGLTWLGVWNSNATYAPDDAVVYLGSSYVAVSPTVGVIPDVGGWDLLASKGDQGPQGLQGDPGVQGPQGPVGPQGDIGPQGPTGPQGDIGPQGLVGATGAQGIQGPAGPTGPQGPAGSSGVAGVWDVSASDLTFATGPTSYVCATAGYTAGANETAIIVSRAGCIVSGGQMLTVRAGYRVGTDAPLGPAIGQQGSTGNRSVASVGTGTLALVQGTTYVFSTAVDVTATPLTGTCACQTVVQVVRQ
jgi:hypothetical protein